MRWCIFVYGILLLVPAIVIGQPSKVDSLQAIINMNKQDSEMVKAFNLLSDGFIRTDVDKAKKYLWMAKKLGTSLHDDRSLSSTFSQLTSIYHNQAQMDSAKFYLSELKELSENATSENTNIINGNYNSTAGLYFKKSGNLREALPFFINAYDFAQKNGYFDSAYGQAINIGNTYLGLSDFNSALNYYLKALKGFEQTKNKKGQSYCYQNIAECYIELNRYSSAIQYINRSIILKKEMNDTRGLGNAEQSLGRIYLGLEEHEKALSHFKKALTIVQELKLSTEEVKVNLNLGKIFTLKNDSEKALLYFEKSRELAQKLGDSSSVIIANLEILSLKNEASTKLDVEKNALLNIQSLKETGAISKEAAGYKNLAEYYTHLKQFDKALEYTNLYNSLNDSIKNNEILAQFKNIEEQYNKEKNEKQIEILQKDQLISSEKLKQQRSLLLLSGAIILFISLGIWMFINRNKLRQRMKEIELRNQIAADLHDEVGSSLSSISMLSKMAINTTDENQQKILNTVSKNAHETMDKIGDIVWMLKPAENSGAGLKERMEGFLHDICSSSKISYTFSADELETLKLSTIQNKNLYLIFKEALNNAMKYSETKVLDVKIATINKHVKMSIIDQGMGFNQDAIEKGNGLGNMKARATELKGVLDIISSPKMGTQIHLSFPLSQRK